jgi:molybdopterin/thiamine biosynthesis adenylyltransferase
LQPQTCGGTENPFGAGAAACFAAANLFRLIFAAELGGARIDEQFKFSVFSQRINDNSTEDSALDRSIRLGFSLIGTGAIGNGLLWSLLHLPTIEGRILLIDNQTVALSNLQRYVLMVQDHVNHHKVDVLHTLLSRHQGLEIVRHPYKWQQVIGGLGLQEMQVVITALDTKEDRFFVQSALPKSILNAWTSPTGVGVSRHPDFTNGPCLACLYLPTHPEKKETQKIADALGMPDGEEFINNYLSNRTPIDEAFVEYVHLRTGIPKGNLSPFVGQLVENLYSEGICGGRVIEVMAGEAAQDVEVPLAHESTMAGILLAAEAVIGAQQLRKEALKPVTSLNMADRIHPYLQEELDKHYTGRCICQDQVFIDCYNLKWQESL